MITFTDSTNNQEWDSFVQTLPRYSFLNSTARCEYMKEEGYQVIQKYIEKDGEKIGIVSGAIDMTKLGKVLDIKHSPLLKEPFNNDAEIWREVFKELKRLAVETGSFFVRVSPLEIKNENLLKIYSEMKMSESPVHNIDALVSQHLDLTKTEEEWRHDMSSSTRNNLNKLQRNPDISFRIFNDESMFSTFENFLKQTMKVKGFTSKSTDSLLRELKKQTEMGMHYMIVGYYKERPISIWTLTKYGKYASIYQAGSDTEFREKNVRITYLLAWESMRLAKELGCTVLDFFGGMVPEGYTGNHPWRGVNDFKMSLGGYKVTYMHCMDIPVEIFKYLIYYWYSYLRTVSSGYITKW